LRLFGRKSSPEDSNTTAQKPAVMPTPNSESAVVQAEPVKTSRPTPIVIPSAQLEKSRRELKTLLFEKELVSSALTRLYEAEASGEITREERESLAVKYRDQLKELDSKIIKIDAFIEVGDLEVLREQLVQLVQQKIEAIEKRIERARPVAGSLLESVAPPKKELVQREPDEIKPKPKVPDLSGLLEEKPEVRKPPEKERPAKTVQPAIPAEEELVQPIVEEPKARKATEKSASDDEIDQLQTELRDALDKLEKLDLEA
jgi:hypothetical protein